jgi:hypothetical protein
MAGRGWRISAALELNSSGAVFFVTRLELPTVLPENRTADRPYGLPAMSRPLFFRYALDLTSRLNRPITVGRGTTGPWRVMPGAERRLTQRFKLRVPMAFHRLGTLFDGESVARSINISTEGVFFTTYLTVAIGERIELALNMPKRLRGTGSSYRRFTGRIVHHNLMAGGLVGVGVQLLCYEIAEFHSPAAAA